MTRDRIMDRYPDQEFMFADGLDQAIIGICDQSGRVIYSIKKIMKILVKQGLTSEEAREHLEFNITGAWVGDQTPIFCDDEM